MANIYDYLDYRDYLNSWIDTAVGGGHGLKKKMAEHLNCQGTFVSQVLHKVAHFSLEHGYKMNSFLEHGAEEADFFMLILLYQRAGNEEVRGYFRTKIETVLKNRLVLKNRIQTKVSLSPEDQNRYYSAWYYGAIRLLITIPGFQTKTQITSRLNLPAKTVSDTLDFLIKVGLLTEKDGRYSPGELHLHLGNDSPLISKHHTNWRLLALNSLATERPADLHYSLGVTLSKEDIVKLKARIVDFIENIQTVVRPSPPETLCGFCIDWFEI